MIDHDINTAHGFNRGYKINFKTRNRLNGFPKFAN